MSRTTIGNRIDWEKLWRSSTIKTSRVSSAEYWNGRAEDYNDYIKNSGFNHGRAIRRVLQSERVLAPGMRVLDIAAGPGSVTIPVAEVAESVTAVEPASEMGRRLEANAKERGLLNIVLVQNRWQDVDERRWEEFFDLTVCSHALWHFPDIMAQVERMNRVSRGHCCIAVGARTDRDFAEMYERLGLEGAEFDRILCFFNLLYERGVLAEVRMLDTVMRRTVQSALSMWELCLGKYHNPTPEQKRIIREHVESRSTDGLYETTNTMAVLWWPADGEETQR